MIKRTTILRQEKEIRIQEQEIRIQEQEIEQEGYNGSGTIP